MQSLRVQPCVSSIMVYWCPETLPNSRNITRTRQKLSPEHGISPKNVPEQPLMIAQYTMLLLALRAAQFVHHVSVLSLEDITRGKGNFIQHARTQLNNRACARRMAEQTGIHDVIFHADARTYVPCHALELIVTVLMLPRPYAVHVRQTHSRQWHKMRDKCCPSRRINF